MRCPPLAISSDDEEDAAQCDLRGGGARKHSCTEDPSMQAAAGAGQEQGHVAGAGDRRDTRGSADVAGYSHDTRGSADVIYREADPIEEASLPEPDPIEATQMDREQPRAERARTPRSTKWGRGERCGAPMRVVHPVASGAAAFLGCTKFRSAAQHSCRFTRSVPPDRYHELPDRVVVRRSR